jgi:hypothetical protein
MLRTVGDTLRVEIGLHVAGVDANPLKINLVFDIGHENEGRDNSLALGGGQLGADLAIPDIMGRGEQCADSALSHGQESRLLAVAWIRVDGGHALRLPVDLGGIAEVFVNGLDVVERVERVFGRLACRVGHARVERVRHERVASAEAEGTDTTVSID